jgi:hypothetical protein
MVKFAFQRLQVRWVWLWRHADGRFCTALFDCHIVIKLIPICIIILIPESLECNLVPIEQVIANYIAMVTFRDWYKLAMCLFFTRIINRPDNSALLTSDTTATVT